MSKEEIEVAQRIAEALNVLPDNKKEYMIGYAEGVVAMSEQQRRSNDISPSTDEKTA